MKEKKKKSIHCKKNIVKETGNLAYYSVTKNGLSLYSTLIQHLHALIELFYPTLVTTYQVRLYLASTFHTKEYLNIQCPKYLSHISAKYFSVRR